MNANLEISDEALVQKIQTTDQELYAFIIERYQKQLWRYAQKLLRDEAQATDVVQESFIKAFINLKSFDLTKKFSSWIYRIVHNETINILKKNKREISLPDDWDRASEQNLEEEFDNKTAAIMVEKCLNQMPILYSEPLVLYYLENKSYEEISDILRLPMGTVATRLNRAKNLMKKICHQI